MVNEIKVYGADWCAMTHRALAHLDELGIRYEYVDVEKDAAAAEWVRAQNGGKEKKPTIQIESTILTEPTNAQLDETLRKAQSAA